MIISSHIRFEPGRHVENTLPGEWALSLTLEGGGIYSHPQGEFRTKRGDLLVLEPSVCFSWRVSRKGPPWEVVWFRFSAPDSLVPWLRLPRIREGHRLYAVTDPVMFRRVRRLLMKAHGYGARHLALCEPLMFNALEEAFLWCQTEIAGSRRPRDPRTDAALRYLGANLGRPVQIRDVARACGVSRTRLLTLFRLHMGMPLMRYLEEERMRRARQLLKTGMMRVKEVAREVGYADQKYFAKRFKRFFGCRPTRCRE